VGSEVSRYINKGWEKVMGKGRGKIWLTLLGLALVIAGLITGLVGHSPFANAAFQNCGSAWFPRDLTTQYGIAAACEKAIGQTGVVAAVVLVLGVVVLIGLAFMAVNGGFGKPEASGSHDHP
jgi:hypothetical protein